MLCFLGGLVAGCGGGGDARTTAARDASAVAASDADAATEGASDEAASSGTPKRLFAKRFVSVVRAAANSESYRIGYLRAGSIHQAKTARPVGHEGCKGGWYELETGGFVCSGLDAIAFEGTKLPALRSVQPDMNADLPYVYGYIGRRVPVYQRLPTDEEAAQYEGYRIPGQEPPAGSDSAGPTAERASPSDAPSSDGGKRDPSPKPAESAAPDRPASGAASTAVATATNTKAQTDPTKDAIEPVLPPTLESLQGERGSVVQRYVMRGFYVSLDKEFRRGRRRYWRTQYNGFVPYQAVTPREGSSYQGVHKPEGLAFPVAVVTRRDSKAFSMSNKGRLRPAPGKVEHRTLFSIAGEKRVGAQLYYHDADGRYYRDRDVRVIDRAPLPKGVGENDKWIDVDLAMQALVAYEGSRPVFITLVSTGKPSKVPEKHHVTPTGTFRILSKHVTAKMDGDNAIDGPYSIDDVPYVMYFQLAYAFHAAFWHDRFGAPKSHGCVNMAPRDAKWLFRWASPSYPDKWHGVYPPEGQQGTLVRIRGETPGS